MNITIPSAIVLAAVVALVYFHEQDKPVAAPAETKIVERQKLVFRPKVIVKTVEKKVETFVDRVVERKVPFPETKVAAFAYPQAVMPVYVPTPRARPHLRHHVGHVAPRAWHVWPQCACDAKWSNS